MIRGNMGSPNQTCDSGVSMDLFLHYSLIPSVRGLCVPIQHINIQFVIVVVLSALQRRSRHLPIDEKLPFLNNRFGIVV
nr:stimulated by retinoic acid gene 6 protein-like [Salvelinus alpinus]